MTFLANIGIIATIVSGGLLTGSKALKYLQEEENIELKNNHLYFTIGSFVFHVFTLLAISFLS
jgi:hypothetical protein